MLGFLVLIHLIQLSSSEFTYECECKKTCNLGEINSTITCGEFIWCCKETLVPANSEKNDMSDSVNEYKNSSAHAKKNDDVANLKRYNKMEFSDGVSNINTHDAVKKDGFIPKANNSDTVDLMDKTKDAALISNNSSFITNNKTRNSWDAFLQKQNAHGKSCDGQILQHGNSCFDQKTLDIGNSSNKPSVPAIVKHYVIQDNHLDDQPKQNDLQKQRSQDFIQLDIRRRNRFDDTGKGYKPRRVFTPLDAQERIQYYNTRKGYEMFQNDVRPTNTDTIPKQNHFPHDIMYTSPGDNIEDKHPRYPNFEIGPQFHRRPFRFVEFYQIPAELLFNLPFIEEYNKGHFDNIKRDTDLLRLPNALPMRFYRDFEENDIPPNYDTHSNFRDRIFTNEYPDERNFRSEKSLQEAKNIPFHMFDLKSNVFQSFVDENNPLYYKLPPNHVDMWS